MLPDSLLSQARELLELCRRKGLRLATAESCTGGLLAACLTEVPGSSDVLERGFVTYSNEAKESSLGVPAELIQARGAVSAEVCRAMAEGAIANSRAQLGAAVTGIAGPGGATDSKPVGLVYVAAARRGAPTIVERHQFKGERAAVRLVSVEAALALLARQAERDRP